MILLLQYFITLIKSNINLMIIYVKHIIIIMKNLQIMK